MKKILIIDDQPIVCNHIAEILKTDYNMEVDISCTYANLERLLNLGNYNAVVLDIMMPFDKLYFADMETSEHFPELSTGKYLFKKIRQRYPKLPVIFHTALQEQIECDGRSMIINKPNLAKMVAKTINEFVIRCEEMN